jgi:hypothetical protein
MNSTEHVVFFPAADGSPAFRRLASLQEAVDFVEHLRNEQGVSEVSVHGLSEVPLAFRTVYRVEVAGAVPAPAESVEGDAAAVVEADADVAPAEEVAPAPVEAAPAAEPVAAPVAEVPAEVVNDAPVPNGEVVGAGADGHSLGFFAD